MSHASRIDWSGLGVDADEAIIATSTPGQADKAEPWYSSVLRSTLPVLATTYQQQQLTKLNIARIGQGLPPLSAQEYAQSYMVPAAQVQVGPTQEAQRLLIWGGAALLLFLGFRAVAGRRR